jgi:hypothetical protein
VPKRRDSGRRDGLARRMPPGCTTSRLVPTKESDLDADPPT